MPVKAPFLIVETGQPVRSMRRYGGFPHWIRVAAGLEADETVVANVERGDALPPRDGLAGVIVSGSAAMVTDRADWSERSADWLRDAAHEGLPLFGICYGHQLLAHALGGEVAYNPAGRESGTVHIDLRPPAQDDPLFSALPLKFTAHAPHVQTVAGRLRAPRCWPARRRTTAMPSAGATAPGASSSTPNSPPTTCAATCMPAPTTCAAKAGVRAPSPAA